jgi:hypothetical protein
MPRQPRPTSTGWTSNRGTIEKPKLHPGRTEREDQGTRRDCDFAKHNTKTGKNLGRTKAAKGFHRNFISGREHKKKKV